MSYRFVKAPDFVMWNKYMMTLCCKYKIANIDDNTYKTILRITIQKNKNLLLQNEIKLNVKQISAKFDSKQEINYALEIWTYKYKKRSYPNLYFIYICLDWSLKYALYAFRSFENIEQYDDNIFIPKNKWEHFFYRKQEVNYIPCTLTNTSLWTHCTSNMLSFSKSHFQLKCFCHYFPIVKQILDPFKRRITSFRPIGLHYRKSY